MNTHDLDRAAITIHKSDVVRLATAHGRRIESVLGRVWITIDGDPRDIVLDTGEGFSVDRDSAVMISALRGDARVLLIDAIAGH
jgi:hypothetical protein